MNTVRFQFRNRNRLIQLCIALLYTLSQRTLVYVGDFPRRESRPEKDSEMPRSKFTVVKDTESGTLSNSRAI
jgi:hypothetical protein